MAKKTKRNTRAKLTKKQIALVKRSLAKGIATTVLAARYGVSPQAISYHKARLA